MSTVIDAQGLSCPEPVLLTHKALNELKSGRVEVIVDNHTAKENVTRAAENLGWKVKVNDQGEKIILELTK